MKDSLCLYKASPRIPEALCGPHARSEISKIYDKFRACDFAFSTLTVKLEVLKVRRWSYCVPETISCD
jgi:hypothetical protein